MVLIVGRKVGNKLIVEGEELHGHQDHLLSRLGTELEKTLNECAESGQTVVVEMPDKRLLTIQPAFDPQTDDNLMDELLASTKRLSADPRNPKPARKPFVASNLGPTNG